jgi:hypothetical protein
MVSVRTDTLFYAADLRSGVAAIPPDLAPAVLWLTLPGGDCVPAWPLTPAAHAALWLAVVKLEDRWYAGDYPRAKLDLVWERWLKIDGWARANFIASELALARTQAEVDARTPPMPKPGPLSEACTPFRDWPAEGHLPLVSRSNRAAKKTKGEPKKKARKRRGNQGGGMFG